MSIDTLGRRAAAQGHRQVAEVDVEAALAQVTGQTLGTRRPSRRILAAAVALVVCAAAITVVLTIAGTRQVPTALQTRHQGPQTTLAYPAAIPPGASPSVDVNGAPLTSGGPFISSRQPVTLRDGSSVGITIRGLPGRRHVLVQECADLTRSSLRLPHCLGRANGRSGRDGVFRARITVWRWYQQPQDIPVIDCRVDACHLEAIQGVPQGPISPDGSGSYTDQPAGRPVPLTFANGDSQPVAPTVTLQRPNGRTGPWHDGETATLQGNGFEPGVLLDVERMGTDRTGGDRDQKGLHPPQDPTGQRLVVADRTGRFRYTVTLHRYMAPGAAPGIPARRIDCATRAVSCQVTFTTYEPSRQPGPATPNWRFSIAPLPLNFLR